MNQADSDTAPTGTPPTGTQPTDPAPTGTPPADPAVGSPPADPAAGWAQRRSAREERRELRRQRRDGTGPLVAGIVLILIGGYFLVRTYLPAIDVDRAWPIILIAIGVVLLARSVRGSGGPAA